MTAFDCNTAAFYDLQIGQNLMSFRKLLKVPRGELAQKLGITYQQIHKYECGVNRLSSGRLLQISQILGIPVEHFFYKPLDEDFPEKTDIQSLWSQLPNGLVQLGLYMAIHSLASNDN